MFFEDGISGQIIFKPSRFKGVFKPLKSRLVILLAHLLKWQYQSSSRCESWRGTIREQRQQIRYLLIDSPSLKNELIGLLNDKNIFKDTLHIVLDETKINPEELPKANIYNYDNMLNADFYPN